VLQTFSSETSIRRTYQTGARRILLTKELVVQSVVQKLSVQCLLNTRRRRPPLGARRQEKRGPRLQIALGVAPVPLEGHQLGAEQELKGMDTPDLKDGSGKGGAGGRRCSRSRRTPAAQHAQKVDGGARSCLEHGGDIGAGEEVGSKPDTNGTCIASAPVGAPRRRQRPRRTPRSPSYRRR
jgi:hypothetical protein